MTIKTLIAELEKFDYNDGEVWVKAPGGVVVVKMIELDDEGDVTITPGDTVY